ncbi:MAG: MFS transporter [Anaerolineales bacterium]|jgi:UMF1 family MFS transporter
MDTSVSTSQASALPRSTQRERVGWYLYDFGNSAYAAVVLLAIYSAYFQGEVVGGPEGSRLWGYAVGIAMLFVAITAPILGTIADFSGAKKRFLLIYTTISCTFTAALFFVGSGDVVMGMVFFILAEIGYRSSQVFYNALLPEIASEEDIGRVSGNGWAIGSAGGIICLVLILILITTIGGNFIIRLSFFITAIYFALSAVPLFVWLRERAEPQPLPEGENYLSLAFKRLGKTFRAVRQYREFLKFMVAFLIYNDGIIMALDFAAILGAVLYGMEQEQLIIFMIIVQVTSVAGAYVFGILTDRISAKRSVVISLVLMIGAVVWMFYNDALAGVLYKDSLTGFFFIGALAGFALTGVQSVSRTSVGMFAPPGKSAEFYGFFAIAGRTSSFIGPAVYGFLAAELAYRFIEQGQAPVVAEAEGLRYALISIIAFLGIGLTLLAFVNEHKARQQSLS